MKRFLHFILSSVSYTDCGKVESPSGSPARVIIILYNIHYVISEMIQKLLNKQTLFFAAAVGKTEKARFG